MATIETLVAQVEKPALRELLSREVAELKASLSWGLLFEQHLPEKARLLSAPIKPGSVVWERRSAKPRRFRVRAVEGDALVVAEEAEGATAADDAPTTKVERGEILVEHDFAQPVFPALCSIERLPHGPADRPTHIVIQGENYDALEVLLATNAADFDVIYVDPPYNTGAKEWSYNNDFVDPADSWRSSKWLAFMNRRLRLARRLLRPDGVLIVTIDEHEVHHLGMLLEQIFPDYLRQMITIVINPKGTGKLNFARVEEYAFFLMPDLGHSVVQGLPKPPAPARRGTKQGEVPVADPILDVVDDERDEAEEELAAEQDAEAEEEDAEEVEVADAALPFPAKERDLWELRHARRRGGESSYRPQRPNQFYRVWIDTVAHKVVRADAESLPIDEKPDLAVVDGLTPVWPIDKEGNERCWRYIPKVMNELIAANRVVLGQFNAKSETWTVNYWAKATGAKKPKTVWWETRYDAGTHGTTLVNTFLGNRGAFSFPKSVYAEADCLAMVVRDRPNAKILDFFAGSGTTLHATWLLNQQYGGNRQCVLVTNNELNYKAVAKLNKAGLFRGDKDYEAKGVFEAATRPRVRAALTGIRPDLQPVKGKYLDGRAFADGFAENVEFFELDYLDGPEVEFGLHFPDIHPLLWLRAGGIGAREDIDPGQPFALPAGSPYAVLFGPSGMPGLLAGLGERTDVTHVFIVADSSATFAQLASELPETLTTVRLYRDYLEAVRSATR
jgi:adenine-specific DNA-methyltransferase